MKRSLFADEIAAGMINELKPEIIKQASVNLVKAVDYLNTAFEILDEAGFKVQADKILNILCKIGGDSFKEVSFTKISPFQALLDAGLTHKDIMEFAKGNKLAIAKLNKKLRDLGYSEDEIEKLLNKKFMSAKEADDLLSPDRAFTKIDEFLKDPVSVRPSAMHLNPGDEFEISTIASKGHDPRRVSDPHTSGLTSEKMIKNLLHHGTEFNMADDGKSDDLLNLEVADDGLEVSEEENAPEMDFEDEI